MDPFEINSDLSTYSAEEINDLIDKGNAVLLSIEENEAPTAADADEYERVVGLLASLEEHRESVAAASESAADRIAALRSARTVEATVEDEEPEPEEAVEEEEEEEPEVEAAAVTAAAKRRRPTAREALSGARPAKPAEPEKPKVVITAAADISGIPTGAHLADLMDVAKAVEARVKGFPTKPMGRKGAPLARYGVASFQREHQFVTDGSKNDYATIMEAAKESRLSGGSLIAAGGWCAPSEVIYDLCDGETTDGIIDLPEIGVSRGGIRFTQGPQFAELYAAGFTQTEAQAIAGTAKDCYDITCPAFEEVRLDAVGICIKVPLLTNAGYPELTRRVTSGSLIAHAHRVSASLITKMVAESTATLAAGVGSVASNTLDAVGLVATTIRQEYRLGKNETLEVVAPHWLLEAIRADLSMRTGVDLLAVTDAQINAYFTARKVRVQWVYNWQDLVDGEEGYPATAQLLVYPAGTFVRGSADVINLDAVYDAASLEVNTMTGLFFEEGVLLAQTCFKSKVVTVPVAAGGITGAASNAATFNLTP